MRQNVRSDQVSIKLIAASGLNLLNRRIQAFQLYTGVG